jgi:DNA-binding NarL/FixJ family response regulator
MSIEMNQQNNNKIEWRRSKVRELLAKGYNHYEIANILQIPRPTITKDINIYDSRIERTFIYPRKAATRI